MTRSTQKTPVSASKFSLHHCYSNANGAHGSPRNCVDKVCYDWDLSNASGGSRVAFTHVSAAPPHADFAKDILTVAKACKKFAGRQCTCRQMSHVTIAVPSDLSEAGRRQLCIDICDGIRANRDGVPVYAALHQPVSGSKNFHIHISHPLRRLVRSRSGTWTLGERITTEWRPGQRVKAGLPKTAHDDIRQLRSEVATQIADALSAEGVNYHIVERWRHGHERLRQQVRRAAQRGDTEFVQDHALREPTKHDWPSGRRSAPSPDSLPNHCNPSAGIERLNGGLSALSRLVDHVVTQAVALKLRRPALLRLLALDSDVLINWYRPTLKSGLKGKVKGVTFRLIVSSSRPFAGEKVDYRFSRLKAIFGWDAQTQFEESPSDYDALFEDYTKMITKFFGTRAEAYRTRMSEVAVLSAEAEAQNWLLQAQIVSSNQLPAAPSTEGFLSKSNFDDRWSALLTVPVDVDAQYERLRRILTQLSFDDGLYAVVYRQAKALREQHPHLPDYPHLTGFDLVFDSTSLVYNHHDSDFEFDAHLEEETDLAPSASPARNDGSVPNLG